MAHKKGVGSSRNGRDSHSQRLGLKKFGGQKVLGGNILARRAVPNGNRATTSAAVRTTRCFP